MAQEGLNDTSEYNTKIMLLTGKTRNGYGAIKGCTNCVLTFCRFILYLIIVGEFGDLNLARNIAETRQGGLEINENCFRPLSLVSQ